MTSMIKGTNSNKNTENCKNKVVLTFKDQAFFWQQRAEKSTTQLTPIPTQPAGRDRCGNNRKCDNIDKRAHQSAGIKKQNLCYTMTFL